MPSAFRSIGWRVYAPFYWPTWGRSTRVDLHRRAGPHATVHEGLLQPDGCPQPREVPAHRARSDRSGQRQQQPANPFRGQPRLLAQPLLDLLGRRPADGPAEPS